MIYLQEQPAGVALTRNQNIYKFRVLDGAGKPYGSTGAKVTLSVNCTNGGFQDGDRITLNWNDADGVDNVISFDFKNTPATDTDLPANDGNLTCDENMKAVAAKMMQHHIFSSLFSARGSNALGATGYVIIEAEEKNEHWSITMTADLQNDTGIAPLSEPFVADNTPAHYRLVIDIFFEDDYKNGDFDKLCRIEDYPDNDGYITIDLSRIIHRATLQAKKGLPIDTYNHTTGYAADTTRRYYIRYAERYGNPVATTAWVAAPVKTILLGGISQQLFAGFDFIAALNATNSILTWYPQGKRVGEETPNTINWYNFNSEEKTIVLEVKSYKPDNTVTTKYVTDATFKIGEKQVLILPAGYKQLILNTTDPTSIKWEIRVVDAASDYAGGNPTYWSEKRRYYLDRDYHETTKVLMYFNAFYLPEIIAFTGDHLKDLEIARLIREKIITPGYKATDTSLAQYDATWENPRTYISGYLSQKEVDALQELLIYNNVFEIYPEGYMIMLVTSKKFKIENTGAFLHTISFTAINRLSLRDYTGTKEGVTPGYWITPGGDTWITPGGEGWQWG